MPKIDLLLKSSNERTLNKFLGFFFDKNDLYQVTPGVANVKRRHKLSSILKSPHVNKASQEQFAQRLVKVLLRVNKTNSNLFILLSKRICLQVFSDIGWQIRLHFNASGKRKHDIINIFNPQNKYLEPLKREPLANYSTNLLVFKLQRYKNKVLPYNITKSFLKSAKMFDAFGEFFLSKF